MEDFIYRIQRQRQYNDDNGDYIYQIQKFVPAHKFLFWKIEEKWERVSYFENDTWRSLEDVRMILKKIKLQHKIEPWEIVTWEGNNSE